MKVEFSTQANTDLREIALYIALDNKARARWFVRELRAKAYEIASMPQAFALVPRFQHAGIRRRVVGDYLIFYTVDRDRVQIIHILHGAQDYERLLFPSNR